MTKAGSTDRAVAARFRRFDALVLISLLWFLGKFVRYAFPPLFEQLSGVYSISTAGLGTLFSGMLLAYAALQFPSGLLADRFSSVTVIGAGGLLAAGGALALAFDSSLVVLVGAMLTIGIGTGTLKTVAVRLLSRTYPSEMGRALGVLDTFGSFGGVIAPAAVVVFAGFPGLFGAGWRTVFLAAGLAGLAVTAAFVRRGPARLPDSSDSVAVDEGSALLCEYTALFREWRFSVFIAATVLLSFAYNATTAFLPLYLTREAGLSPATASLLYSLLFVVSLVQLGSGEVSDRIGRLSLIVATLALASAGLGSIVLLTGVAHPLALGGAIVCFGVGAHGFRPVRSAYLMGVIPDSVAGGGLGVVRTFTMAAGAFSPALVGLLSEYAGFQPAFWLLTVTLIAATGFSLVLWLFK